MSEGGNNYSNTRWQEYNSIIDSTELDLKEKGILLVIFRYVNYKTGYADPSRALIKKLTGIKKDETLDKIFNSLIEKGFIVREIQKGKRSKYYVKVPLKNGGATKSEGTTQNRGAPPLKIGGTLPPKNGEQKENKRKGKEYIDLSFIDEVIDKVEITQEEYKKLTDKFGAELLSSQILALDNYIANGKGIRYKDHYRVLNTWCADKQPKIMKGQVCTDDDGIREF